MQCGRCRKRKIRCSGDPGDGTQCNNCKQAGLDQGQCQFLRVRLKGQEIPSERLGLTCALRQVGSKDVSCPSNGTTYPYGLHSSLAATNPLPGGHTLGPYPAVHLPSSSSQGSLNLQNPAYYGRIPSVQHYNGAYPMALAKPTYQSSYTVPGPGEGQENYSSIPQQYVLPSNDLNNANAVYTSQESVRGWTPITQSTKSSASNLFVEQESPPYTTTQLPYLTSTVERDHVTSDGSSYFPTMTTLSTSLPAANAAQDRLLPKPHGSVTANESVSAASNGTTPSQGPKQTWTGDDGSRPKCSRPEGLRVVSASTMLNGPPSATNSVSQQPCQACAPMSMSPVSSSPTAPSLPYSTGSLPVAAIRQTSYSVATSSTCPPACKKEASLPSHNSSSNLYSFGSHNSHKRGSNDEASSGDATLVSGQQYTRLRQQQPQPQHTATFDSIHRRSPIENAPEKVHRASVSSHRT